MPNFRTVRLDVVKLADFEVQAIAVMPRPAYEFVAAGVGDEITTRWNVEAYERIRLRQRVLTDVQTVNMAVTLFGREHPVPILLAPTAYHRALHPEGELATAKGAGAAGATFVVSSATTTAIEEIKKVATAPLWFQLYIQRNRDFTEELVERVQQAGCEALVLTVDAPVLGTRNRQARSGFRLPVGISTPHLSDKARVRHSILDRPRANVTWADVRWLKDRLRVPLLLKGIMTADDAALAVDSGADGIIVSNHGGRILDTVPATIDVLPEIAARVAGRVPLLVDGGILRGTSVLKACARGASAVLLGRPYCYALALAGAAGVQRAVNILKEELRIAMILTGIASLEQARCAVDSRNNSLDFG